MATTAELKRWEREGARIVTIHHGEQTVTWKPRQAGDRKPWVIVGKPVNIDDFRFRAAELKAVTQGGGPWSVGRLLQL